MKEPTPPTKGRKIFNGFAAFVLVLFVLFCLAMTVSVLAIPKLLERQAEQPYR